MVRNFIDALKESDTKDTLVELSWQSDLFDDDDEEKYEDLIEEICNTFVDDFENLQVVNLNMTLMEHQDKYELLKELFKEKGKKVIFSAEDSESD